MALLEVKDLHKSFFTDAGEVKAVNGVSFNLDRGETLGIVGESGSGKSVTVYSIMQILAPAGKIVSGSVKLDGQELVGAGEKVMRDVRGNKISIIFQDPMTSLNPTYTIGHQLMEAITLHTNRNRQLPALASTTGRKKTEVVAEHILDINPKAQVETKEFFYLPEQGEKFFADLGEISYVVDAIDTITAKIDLACRCEKLGIPLIASMGTGNKLDPTRFEVADIYDTSVDPLARVMRKKLKEHGVRGLKVVYSKEQPLAVSQPGENPDGTPRRRRSHIRRWTA